MVPLWVVLRVITRLRVLETEVRCRVSVYLGGPERSRDFPLDVGVVIPEYKVGRDGSPNVVGVWCPLGVTVPPVSTGPGSLVPEVYTGS